MSTFERAAREGEGAHADEDHQRGADDGGGASENMRMRAMHRRWVQRKTSGAGGGGGQAAIPEAGGAPLANDVRGKMERTLGADLSGVRVHTGGESAEAAEGMGARAFTVGGDVHFNRGEFAPGSKEGDRLLAHELTHVVQGQKSGVQRKASADGEAADGDHEAGGHEVSEPGDASEQEADAAGDHAADALHGDKGEPGADGAAEGAQGAAAAGGEKGKKDKPQIGAAAAGVSRKIFRAKKDGANKGAPPPAAAGKPAPAGGGKAAPAGAAGAAAPAISPQDQQKATKLKTTLETAPVAPMLHGTLESAQKELTRLSAGPGANDPAIAALKATYEAKRAALDEAFDTALNGAAAAMTQINTQLPTAFSQFQATWKTPEVDKWAGLAMFSLKDRPSAIAFKQARETKEKVIRDKHRETMSKALADMRQVGNEPDPAKPDDNPMAHADAVFDGVRTWMNVMGGPTSWESQLQDAYMAKREQINAATAAREAKKAAEQAAAAEKEKQKQEEQKKQQAQQQPAAGGGPAAAGGGEKKEQPAAAAPGGAAAAAPAPAAAAGPQEKKPQPPGQSPAPAAQAQPEQAKPKPVQTPPAQGQAPPGAAAGVSAPAPAPAAPQQKEAAAPPPQPAPAQAGPQQEKEKPGASAAAAAPAAAPAPQAQAAPGQHQAAPEQQGPGAAPPAQAPQGEALTPEQENKLQQLEVMLEIASAEASDLTNAFNLGATTITNLMTVANPGFLMLALGKSAAVLTAKFKHEFETKVAGKMLKQMTPEQIDELLLEWTTATPDYERVMADIKVSHGKALNAKAKVGAGLQGAGQLGKDDWKELAVEGGEIAEHVAKEMVQHLPHALEVVGHALPFVGIAASVWGVIANVRKVRHLRHELKELQDKKFGPGGQPAPAPAAAAAPTHH